MVALTDANGTCVQTYEYSVYGHVAAEDPNHPNPFMFIRLRRIHRPGIRCRNRPATQMAGKPLQLPCPANGVSSKRLTLRRNDQSLFKKTIGYGDAVKRIHGGLRLLVQIASSAVPKNEGAKARYPDLRPATGGLLLLLLLVRFCLAAPV